MSDDDNRYFDITIKHKYDSVTTKRRRRLCIAIIITSMIVTCSSLMIFSNDVSSISEASINKEGVSGKTEVFPETTIEAKHEEEAIPVMSTTLIVVESADSETNTMDVPVPDVTDDASVTMKQSSEIKISKKSVSNKNKKQKKTKTKNKRKQKKKSKKKAQAVFSNISTKHQKAKAIWTCLEQKGYEDGAIAGILGNIEQESDFNEKHSSNNSEKYKGMFQLSKHDRFQNCIDWCEQNGYDPWSVKGQLYFMLEEMNSKETRTYQFKHFTGYDKEDYKNINSPEKAASVWVAGYEGAISSGSGLNATWQQEERRRQYALEWYKKFSS